MNELIVFDNPEFGKIRVMEKDGAPWFVAADVCRALDLGNSRQALTRLDDDEKGVISTDTPGGKQDVSIVNEPGLYSLVLGSRKPEAKGEIILPQFIDITGERFGRLLAVSHVTVNGRIKWNCKCDCGGETETSVSKLRSGHTQSCGCLQRERASLAAQKDYTGIKFGRLTAKKRIEGEHTKYLCICECGKNLIVDGGNLATGATKSCGCLRSEMLSKADTKHGGCKTRLYKTWRNMLDRCKNPKNKEYHRYGGRGITVYTEWETNFIAFRDWAISSGYHDDLTIDRIDNDLGYSPFNCQWLTKAENSAKIKTDKKQSDAMRRKEQRII